MILACGLGLGLALVGCGDDDPVSKAIGEAEESFAAARSAAPDGRAQKFGAAASELSVSGDAVPGAEAEASRLLAQARSAQAWEQMRPATDAASDLFDLVTRGEALLAQLHNLHARAKALEDFSPASQFADLESRLDERTIERQGVSAELAEARADYEQFIAEAEEQGQLARDATSREQSLRIEASDANPVARAQLISQAVQQARVAAEYESRQGDLELEADLAGGKVRDLEGRLEVVDKAIAAIEGASAALKARQGEIDRQAAELRGRATAARSALDELLNEGKTLLDDTLNPAIDEALSTLSQASSAAGRARGADGTAGKVTAATVDHSIYAVQSIRAMATSSFADLVNRVAGSDAGSGSVASSMASALQSEASEANEAAAQAADKAASSLGSTGVRGEGAGEMFERLAASLSGQAPSDQAQDADTPEPEADGAGEDDTGDAEPDEG